MKYHNSNQEEVQEISIRIEKYDDIFSDFDIRPYQKRSLSADFLEEIKRAALDKNDQKIEFTLHVPKEQRNESHEQAIKDRLLLHFKKHYKLQLAQKRAIIKRGIFMVFLGAMAAVGATLVVFNNIEKNLFASFLLVFLEPASWFLLWEGMDQIIFSSKETTPDLDFYKKMSSSHLRISFTTY